MIIVAIFSSVIILQRLSEVACISLNIATVKNADDTSVVERTGSVFSDVKTQEAVTTSLEILQATGNTDNVPKRKPSVLLSEATVQSKHFEKVTESHFVSTGIRLNKVHNNESTMVVNQTLFQYTPANSDGNSSGTQQNDGLLTTETSLSSPDDNAHKEILPNEKLLPNIQYHMPSEADRVHRPSLDRKKIPLQHHLHLVPMEDEPFGAIIMKDHQILVSVLIPIGVGIIGTAMIVGTICTLRYVARKRSHWFPIDNGIETEGPNTPCISSISTEATDKVFLLLGDEEI